MMQCIRMNNWKYTYKLNHSSIIAIKSQYYHIARLNQVHIIILQFHNIYIYYKYKTKYSYIQLYYILYIYYFKINCYVIKINFIDSKNEKY